MDSTLTSPSPAPATPAGRPRIREPQPTRAGARDRAWLWVLLLTYAAIFILFYSISFGSPDHDGALVYWRTCGTYHQLLEILRSDGFVPLHYEFYWALKHFCILTPGVLRFLPALAGVLMVPAMYFLARQLVSQRAALVIAAFTATSAHIGMYAQHAKMYSHCWLCCTLSMACLLWWVRNRSGVAWWCWVASSVAATGLYSLAWCVIALQPLVLLAHQPRWRMVLAMLIGLIVIGIGPAVYYTYFNRWTSNIREQGWQTSGLAWIPQFNASQTPGELVMAAYSDYLLGRDYPAPTLSGITDAESLHRVPAVIAVLLLLGAFPWPTRARGRGRSSALDPAPQPWWRSSLVLALWIVLTPYAFYCLSFDGYRWPHELLADLWLWLCASPKLCALTLAMLVFAAYCCGESLRQRLLRLLQLATISSIILALASGIAWAARHRPPGPLWDSHYIAIVWPAVMIATVVLILRIPSRPLRWLVILVLLAMNLSMCVDRTRWRRMPPIDFAAMDVVLTTRPGSGTYVGFLDGEAPALLQYTYEGQYYLHLLGNVEIAPYGWRLTPHDFKAMSPVVASWIPEQCTWGQILSDLASRPDITRLIVWDRIPSPETNQAPDPSLLFEPAEDDLLPQLPGTWQRINANRYACYQYPKWVIRGIWRRREYVRQDTPPAGK